MGNLAGQAGGLIGRLRGLWPWWVSAAVHVAALLPLSALVFVRFTVEDRRREVIPDARLAKQASPLPLYLPKPLLDHYLTQQERVPERLSRAGGADRRRPASPARAKAAPLGGTQGAYELRLPSADLTGEQLGQPAVDFFSSGGTAYSVVYVVDRSGSMVLTLAALKRELKRSLRALQPMQKFHVIFFNAGEPLEAPGGRLVWATRANVQRCCRFIDTVFPEGRTNPASAIRRALALKPDLIYLLTDGDFDPQIVEQISALNTAGVKINTIAYTSERGGILLRRIAARSGGVYRYVAEEELVSSE